MLPDSKRDDPAMLDEITIPSMLLFQHDADLLKETLMEWDNHPRLPKNETKFSLSDIRVQLDFPIPPPPPTQIGSNSNQSITSTDQPEINPGPQRVEYSLWLSPTMTMAPEDANHSVDLSQDYVPDLLQVVQVLQEHAFFTPRTLLYNGNFAGCRVNNDDPNEYVYQGFDCVNSCSNGGRYCDAKSPLIEQLPGSSVEEGLRRICIWKLYGESNGIGLPWWEYLKSYSKFCKPPISYDPNLVFPDCISHAMNMAGVDADKVNNCMLEAGGTRHDRPNTLLSLELNERSSSVFRVPTLTVNGAIVRGALNFATAFWAICAGFPISQEKPPVCQACATCHDPQACVSLQYCPPSTTEDKDAVSGVLSLVRETPPPQTFVAGESKDQNQQGGRFMLSRLGWVLFVAVTGVAVLVVRRRRQGAPMPSAFRRGWGWQHPWMPIADPILLDDPPHCRNNQYSYNLSYLGEDHTNSTTEEEDHSEQPSLGDDDNDEEYGVAMSQLS